MSAPHPESYEALHEHLAVRDEPALRLDGVVDPARPWPVVVGERFAFKSPAPIAVTMIRRPAFSKAEIVDGVLVPDVRGVYSVRVQHGKWSTACTLVAFDRAFIKQNRFEGKRLLHAHVAHSDAPTLFGFERSGELPTAWHQGAEKGQL